MTTTKSSSGIRQAEMMMVLSLAIDLGTERTQWNVTLPAKNEHVVKTETVVRIAQG